MQLLRKFSANNKTSVFKYKSLAERSDRESLPYACSRREHNRSRIRYRLLTNWKIIRAMVSACPAIFRRSQCIRTERHLFVWEDRNPLRLQNSERTIFNLSLSRYDANLSRLTFRNLKESMNLNFTSFFWKFFSVLLSLVLSTCLMNEIYFSFVIDSIIHLHVHRMQ